MLVGRRFSGLLRSTDTQRVQDVLVRDQRVHHGQRVERHSVRGHRVRWVHLDASEDVRRSRRLQQRRHLRALRGGLHLRLNHGVQDKLCRRHRLPVGLLLLQCRVLAEARGR